MAQASLGLLLKFKTRWWWNRCSWQMTSSSSFSFSSLRLLETTFRMRTQSVGRSLILHSPRISRHGVWLELTWIMGRFWAPWKRFQTQPTSFFSITKNPTSRSLEKKQTNVHEWSHEPQIANGFNGSFSLLSVLLFCQRKLLHIKQALWLFLRTCSCSIALLFSTTLPVETNNLCLWVKNSRWAEQILTWHSSCFETALLVFYSLQTHERVNTTISNKWLLTKE